MGQSRVRCFHNENERDGYMSNWYMRGFVRDGHEFVNVEQYFMYCKAMTFGDTVIAEEILKRTDQKQIKALGRRVKNFDKGVWDSLSYDIMLNGVREKFKQNKDLAEQLLATGDDILAEAAVNDTKRGIGLGMRSLARLHQEQWKGKNWLGKILMQVREEFRQGEVI